MDPASDHGDCGVVRESGLVVEGIEPALDVGDPAPVVGGQRDRRDDPRHPLDVA